jgi:hypothetical protein
MLFRVPDTNFSIPGPRGHRIPDPDPAGILIADPGSGFVSHHGSPDPNPATLGRLLNIWPFCLDDEIQKQQQKRGVKIISCHAIFCSHKLQKIKNYFIFEMLKKIIWANLQRI